MRPLYPFWNVRLTTFVESPCSTFVIAVSAVTPSSAKTTDGRAVITDPNAVAAEMERTAYFLWNFTKSSFLFPFVSVLSVFPKFARIEKSQKKHE